MPKKFIWEAVILSLIVGLCFIIIPIANKSRGSINKNTSQLDKVLSPYEDMQYAMYEDSAASGDEIIDLIRNISDDGVIITVKNGASSVAQNYTYASVKAQNSSVLKDITDKSNKTVYINPSASFSSSITRDGNGVITSVNFIQKK